MFSVKVRIFFRVLGLDLRKMRIGLAGCDPLAVDSAD